MFWFLCLMLFATGCGALTVDTPLLAALQHGFTVFAMSYDWGGVGGGWGWRWGEGGGEEVEITSGTD